MSLPAKADKQHVFFKYIIAATILAGAVARIIVYLQNRNLIIDEANVTRNLYERSFAGLVLPLKYEQYAPPVFLWIEKLNTVLFGFSEYALRLWPLITGLAALYIFYRVLKALGVGMAAWFPLLLFACSHICIRYSSEVKQYMFDILIVLSLILLALRLDMRKYSPVKFSLIWFVAGSIAIWSSMPSVFVLTGIGLYYGWNCIKEKDYKGIVPIAVTGALWLAQFAFYYFAILEPQANSSYLQRFHQYSFFNIFPDKPGELQHDIRMYKMLAGQFSGEWPFALLVNTLFMLTGIVVLLKKKFSHALLLLTPLTLLLIAAALRQFSLVPRVALFSLPLMMILTGYGFYIVWQAAAKPALRTIAVVIALYPAASNIYYSLYAPYKYEELTQGLRWLQQKGITGNYLYLYHSSGPAFEYYTQIHPGKKQWEDLAKDYLLLHWSRSYTSLSWEMKYMWRNTKPVGFVFTNGTNEEVYYRVQDMKNFMKQKACYDNYAVKAFIFQKN